MWRYVFNESEGETGSQKLGTEVHAILESRLMAKPLELEVSGEAMRLANLYDVESLRTITESVEQWIEFPWAGHKMRGKIDVVLTHGVLDYKTTSSVSKYSKSTEELAHSTQMIIYAHWWLTQHPEVDKCSVTHVYFQTSGKALTKQVSVNLSRDEVREGMFRLAPKIHAMATAAVHQDLFAVTPDYKKCKRCPFKAKCEEKESEKLMSLLDPTTDITTTKPVVVEKFEVRETTVSVSWTINIGDYNSLRVDYGVTAAGDPTVIEEHVRTKIKEVSARAVADRKAK